ncbi:MAG TPA: hypothetical protein VIK32_02445, partial [Candidatus Limnocylindrales bacterium]
YQVGIRIGEALSAFEKERCGILGALLDAISCALRRYDEVELDHLPRMADFVHLVTAAEPALGWTSGSFARVLEANSGEARRTALDSDPLSQVIVEYMAAHRSSSAVEKTPTDWLAVVRQLWPDAARSQTPANPATLSDRLKRLSPSLRSFGIGIEIDRLTDHNRTRVIRMWNVETTEADQGVQSPSDDLDRHASP